MRKKQAASAEAAIQAAVNAAQGVLSPPKHVVIRPGDMPFWDGVMRARARDEWIEADLVVAAQLARVQADIERESKTLDVEGTVVTNERGTPVCNPRVSVLEQMARREMALMRTLRMGGKAAGDPRLEAASRRTQQRADRIHADLAEDELLA